MRRFETQPHYRSLSGVRLKDKPFELTKILAYHTNVLSDMPLLIIPSGFRSDLASIPRLARFIFSVAGWWRDAAWPHDFCCDPVDGDLNPTPHFCDYKQAAEIWHEALEDTIEQMDISVNKKKRKLRTAKILVWFVKVGGPKFKAGE